MAKIKILLVDDEPTVRETIDKYLSDFGYEIDYAENCLSAADKLKNTPYTVVLIDLHMKNFDGKFEEDAGIDLLKFIEKENYDVPAIILTSYPSVPSVKDAMLIGAADYVEKTPDQLEKLANLIEKKMNKNTKLIIEIADPSLKIDEIRTDIFQKLFNEYEKIIIHEFSKGSRGAVLYRINFQDQDGVWNIPLIVKIGWRDEILREISGFKTYVRHKIPEGRCPEIYNSAFSGKYGGITYSFVGASEFSKTLTLKDYFRTASPKDIELVIENVFEKLFRIWHENKGNKMPLNIFDEYINVLFDETKLEKAVKTYLSDYYHQDIISYDDIGVRFTNPLKMFKEMNYKYETSTYISITHGDLNIKNILIDHDKNIWLIDFDRCGRAHILCDYAELETSIKYSNIDFENIKELYRLEDALLNQVDFKDKIKYQSNDKEIQKIVFALRKLREMAFYAVSPSNDITEYFISLLFYTLNMLRFSNKDLSKDIKKVILYSASRLITNISSRI
ncbi:MAG: response regulator [Desulfobacteraceae bacterium]|nr:response regulator [Desulfobacteraceae bacterium]